MLENEFNPPYRGIIVQLFGEGGGSWKKTCTFSEKLGRKPVLGAFLLFLTQKFAILTIFGKIMA